MNESESTVSILLSRASQGDTEAREQLFKRVGYELEGIARGLLRRERDNHSWQTIDLVNEVAVKLIQSNALKEHRNRAYFFAAVARSMRQLLVDHARKRNAKKRPQNSVPLDDVLQCLEQEQRIDVLALNDALERLKQQDARKHDVVQLRFFGGMKFKEIADYLQVSVPTIERDWKFAQAWLRIEMSACEDETG